MTDREPLVTIGIPTYNREVLIRRAIESAINQDYLNIEIIISDNNSTDSTLSVCQELCARDARIRYIRQPSNVGATRNFAEVLKQASGEYFMWLGDDDYVDLNYISTTLRALQHDPSVALASGLARYYCGAKLINTGREFSIESTTWWRRIAEYYWKVSDNGVFYGLMRTAAIRQVTVKNALGGDWLAIACMAAGGKIVMLNETAVHRELGGASQTLSQAAKSLGLPRMHAVFPYLSIAANAFADISIDGSSYEKYSIRQRRLAGALVFLVLLVRAFTTSIVETLVILRNSFRRKSNAA